MYIQLLARSSCSVLPRGALLRFLWNSERSHFFVLSPAVVKENSNLNTLQEVLCKPKKCLMDKRIVLLFLQLVLLSWNFHSSCSHTGSGWTVSTTLDITRLKTTYRLKVHSCYLGFEGNTEFLGVGFILVFYSSKVYIYVKATWIFMKWNYRVPGRKEGDVSFSFLLLTGEDFY